MNPQPLKADHRPCGRGMPWAVRICRLCMSYGLTHGHHGTSPCITDHREAVGPVGAPADHILSFVITQQAPFALLVTASVGRPVPTGHCQYENAQQKLELLKPMLCGHSHGHTTSFTSQYQAIWHTILHELSSSCHSHPTARRVP